VPRTDGIDELFQRYFGDDWHIHDLRARGLPALLRGEPVVIDQDFVDAQEVDHNPFYQEFLTPLGFRWFAGVGFCAGPALWVLAIQRTIGEGAFTPEEKSLLAPLSPLLTEAATLSTAVGRRTVAGMANALDLLCRPAIAVDRMGTVVETNAGAHALFGEELQLRQRRLVVRDRSAAAALAAVYDRMRTVPDTVGLDTAPIVVRRDGDRPLVIRVLRVGGAAQSPFLGARALLVLTDLGRKPEPDPNVVARAFDLTRAEARLASLVASGLGLGAVAKRLEVSRETVRAQLKAVFAKTQTHRQSELVALLLRLASLVCGALSLELGFV
jgi:DNA-binding CsgD family transcriptional regulator